MAVTIIRKGAQPVQLIAPLGPCKSESWPFPGDKHILNPITRNCVRCGVPLPKDYVGFRAVVPESMRDQVKQKTLKEEVGL